MADDQGWGDMAYNGHPQVKTPNFDAMAREGVRFDQFHAAAPVCSPTRGSVMTGRTPNRFGCLLLGAHAAAAGVTIGRGDAEGGLPHRPFRQVAPRLRAEGQPGLAGCERFDSWVSAPNFFDLDPILSDQGRAVQFKGDSSDITADLALKFIRQCAEKDQRFLAVVWFGSPHSPHKALDADRDLYADQPKNVRDFYGEITAMDRAFGRIREELKKLDLRDETVLWYCSDNGALPKIGSSGGRRGNKGKIYEGGLLVPSLLEWPAQFKEPKVITTPCVTSDILPTIADITGAKPSAMTCRSMARACSPCSKAKINTRSKPIGFWDAGKGGISTPSDKWMAISSPIKRRASSPVIRSVDAGCRKDRRTGLTHELCGSFRLARMAVEAPPHRKEGRGGVGTLQPQPPMRMKSTSSSPSSPNALPRCATRSKTGSKAWRRA
jgi:hypothetical protein